MLITEDIFRAFLRCETKSHLKLAGAVGDRREFSDWERKLAEDYQQQFCTQLRSNSCGDELLRGVTLTQALANHQCRFALDCVVRTRELQSHIPLLERITPAGKITHLPYIPVRFLPREKITPHDKLLVAFDALVLSIASGTVPRFGKIIHGSEYAVTKVTLDELVKTARAAVEKITAQQASCMPQLVLNKHCAECEFKARCRQLAIEKDELSLLSGMTEKEIKKQHNKGIFSVTQLSYTFRARRKPKRFASRPEQHSHALRALAIRERKIHIAGKLELKMKGNPVYLDVEGVPDRDLYYLIGLRFKSGESEVQSTFWANEVSEEKEIWASFLQTLAKIESPQLIYYGSYETTFLKRMKERYGDARENSAFVDQLIADSLNLLSVIYAHLYFPTYSNGLKDIAKYLGFQWSESGASGFSALTWRLQWELSRQPNLKQKLIVYNSEDCAALKKVTECIYELAVKASLPNSHKIIECTNAEIAWVRDMAPETSRSEWGTPTFLHPDFQYINKCAYFDYQRERVFIHTSSILKKGQARTVKTKKRKKIKINKHVEIKSAICPFCKSTNVIRDHNKMRTKLLLDLKIISNGIKGQMVACTGAQHRCLGCERIFRPFSKTSIPQSYKRVDKYSHGLKSWAIYQHLAHRISFESLQEMIKEYFGLNIRFSDIHIFKSLMAEYYRPTYTNLIKKLVTGRLMHADETEIKLKKSKGYIWVFTSLEEVVFMYKPRREGDFLKELLIDYKGVLISDFYSVYDCIPSAQQKCLIHLMRDLNNDLLKNPFNEELKGLIQEFASLLRPMIETVDRFGLKAHFLRKHKVFVERFYGELSKRDYQSEIAIHYKKRFEKNRDKLFTFLDYDGVPWNNNNAEHAIKQFAHYRMISDGKMTEPGLNNYLILFSIYQTCRYKGISFFRFLLSGERDLDKFYEGGQKKREVSSKDFRLIVPNAELVDL